MVGMVYSILFKNIMIWHTEILSSQILFSMNRPTSIRLNSGKGISVKDRILLLKEKPGMAATRQYRPRLKGTMTAFLYAGANLSTADSFLKNNIVPK